MLILSSPTVSITAMKCLQCIHNQIHTEKNLFKMLLFLFLENRPLKTKIIFMTSCMPMMQDTEDFNMYSHAICIKCNRSTMGT